MNSLALSIAADRQRIGMTQDQLADRLGVSQQSVSNWEEGKSVPRLKRLEQISSVFGKNSQTAQTVNDYLTHLHSRLSHTHVSQSTERQPMASVRPPPVDEPEQPQPIHELTRAAVNIAAAAESLAQSAAQIAQAVARLTNSENH